MSFILKSFMKKIIIFLIKKYPISKHFFDIENIYNFFYFLLTLISLSEPLIYSIIFLDIIKRS